MTHDYDCAIIGLGIVGSSVAYHLAARGARVLAVDRFTRRHDLGSSSGDTRMVQHLVFGGSAYAPLLRKVLGAWRELEQESGESLFFRRPALLVGAMTSPVLQQALRGPAGSSTNPRALGPSELAQFYPGARFSRTDIGVLDESAGLLRADKCIESVQRLAEDRGAEIRFGVRGEVDWSRTHRHATRIRLQGRAGSIRAKWTVVAAGPWVGQLLPRAFRRTFSVERIVQYWFEEDVEQPDRPPLPTLMLDRLGEIHAVIPSLEKARLRKVIPARGNSVSGENDVDRTVSASERDAMRRWQKRNFSFDPWKLKRCSVCMYTTTADDLFVIDRLPTTSVVVASACCGRGFKYAPAIGRAIASMVSTGRSSMDLEPFRLQRPGLTSRSPGCNAPER